MQLARGSLCVSSRKGQTSDCAWVPGKAHPLFYNAAITITTITEGWDQINNNSDCFEIGWSFANDIRWYFMVFRWVQSLNLIHTDNHKYEQKCACAQSHWMHNIVVYMHVHCPFHKLLFPRPLVWSDIWYMHVSVNFELEIRRDIILCETYLKAYTLYIIQRPRLLALCFFFRSEKKPA